jgi:hypothetical protein
MANSVKFYFQKPAKRSFSNMLLLVSGSVIGWAYKIAFGWLDELLYQRDRKRFIREIEQGFAELFSKRVGKVVSHEGKNLIHAFDYVSVTVEFDEILVRVTRGRGEMLVQVSPRTEPKNWLALSTLWDRIALPEWGRPPSIYDEPGEIAQRLDTCWDRLVPAL